MKNSSSISENEWKYPLATPYANGWLQVSEMPFHKIYWEEYGNLEGEPVIFLHGGPGGGTTPAFARFFNPERYRILLFDQRGCGKSTPNAADADPLPALRNNTTDHLIDDIIALLHHRNITDRFHLFGGSWGSTLALAFAIRHPEKVATLILRGIFLCRRKDLDYFYQGNAAFYERDPDYTSIAGAYLMFPEAWRNYVKMIPPAERHDMVAAYAHRFAEAAHPEAEALARAWSYWEGVTSFLSADESDTGKFSDPTFANAFARIENHYFMNGAFLDGSGERGREQNYILAHAERLRNIPTYIVHGRYDQVCPLFQAEELAQALRAVNAIKIDYRITLAGHSMLERENYYSLVEIMDSLPLLN